MKYSEFLKFLQIQLVDIETTKKGSHRKLKLNGKQSVLPYHGSKAIGAGLIKKIKQDLELK